MIPFSKVQGLFASKVPVVHQICEDLDQDSRRLDCLFIAGSIDK